MWLTDKGLCVKETEGRRRRVMAYGTICSDEDCLMD